MKHRNFAQLLPRCCFEDDYQDGDEVSGCIEGRHCGHGTPNETRGKCPHKQNKEFQMFATAQRETQKLDLVLPFSNSYVPCCVGNLRQGIDAVI